MLIIPAAQVLCRTGGLFHALQGWRVKCQAWPCNLNVFGYLSCGILAQGKEYIGMYFGSDAQQISSSLDNDSMLLISSSSKYEPLPPGSEMRHSLPAKNQIILDFFRELPKRAAYAS